MDPLSDLSIVSDRTTFREREREKEDIGFPRHLLYFWLGDVRTTSLDVRGREMDCILSGKRN